SVLIAYLPSLISLFEKRSRRAPGPPGGLRRSAVSIFGCFFQLFHLLAYEVRAGSSRVLIAFGQNGNDLLGDKSPLRHFGLNGIRFGQVKHVARTITVGRSPRLLQPLPESVSRRCRIGAADGVPQQLPEHIQTGIEFGWILQRMNGNRALPDNGLVITWRIRSEEHTS